MCGVRRWVMKLTKENIKLLEAVSETLFNTGETDEIALRYTAAAQAQLKGILQAIIDGIDSLEFERAEYDKIKAWVEATKAVGDV